MLHFEVFLKTDKDLNILISSFGPLYNFTPQTDQLYFRFVLALWFSSISSPISSYKWIIININ